MLSIIGLGLGSGLGLGLDTILVQTRAPAYDPNKRFVYFSRKKE